VLVFSGPGAYVSPVIYDTTPAAPTWNFSALHLRGTIEQLADSRRIDVVTRTVAAFERDHGRGWDMTGSLGYFQQLAPGIGAFRFTVSAHEQMFKLSQEKPVEVRQRVAAALADSPAGSGRDVAAAMCRYGVTSQ
jgi:transcriptional regulator